jgi:hypothetical protein
MELKRELLDLLKRGYEEEQAFIAGLSDEEHAAVGTSEEWSAKDVLAHIGTWKERRAQTFITWASGEPLTSFEDYDHINARDFEDNWDRSWEEVLALVQRGYELLVKSVSDLSEDDLRALPQGNRTIWMRVAGVGYAHPVIHLTDYLLKSGRTGEANRVRDESFTLLTKLDQSPWWQGLCRYNLACHYALVDQPEKAIETLRGALQLNPDLAEWSRNDSDLASLRERLDYKALYPD